MIKDRWKKANSGLLLLLALLIVLLANASKSSVVSAQAGTQTTTANKWQPTATPNWQKTSGNNNSQPAATPNWEQTKQANSWQKTDGNNSSQPAATPNWEQTKQANSWQQPTATPATEQSADGNGWKKPAPAPKSSWKKPAAADAWKKPQADPAKEEVGVILPEPMFGKIRLKIDYQGSINDKMAGFYRSKYTYQGTTGFIAVTQFEESDARRAFPCMDHPAKKATFDIKIDIDNKLVAISNGAVAKEDRLDNGKKRITFEHTPKMWTYLVFFGIGEFEFTRDKKDSRVRVVTLPGMKKYAKFSLP